MYAEKENVLRKRSKMATE